MATASAHDLLAPLAARYGAARGGPVVIPPEPDGVVRAMPIVLRLERPPAGRTAVRPAGGRSSRRTIGIARTTPSGSGGITIGPPRAAP